MRIVLTIVKFSILVYVILFAVGCSVAPPTTQEILKLPMSIKIFIPQDDFGLVHALAEILQQNNSEFPVLRS